MRIQGGTFYIGQHSFPASSIKREDCNFADLLDVDTELLERVFNTPEPISRVRQAMFEFNSGWCVSIIWGTSAMCENQNRGLMNSEEFKEEVTNAEIDIFHKEHDIHVNPNDMTVGRNMYAEGYANGARVKDLLFFTASLPEPTYNDIANAADPGEITTDHIEEEDLPDEDF